MEKPVKTPPNSTQMLSCHWQIQNMYDPRTWALGPSLPVERARVVHDVHGRRVEHIAQTHDPLRRDVLHHSIVQSGGIQC